MFSYSTNWREMNKCAGHAAGEGTGMTRKGTGMTRKIVWRSNFSCKFIELTMYDVLKLNLSVCCPRAHDLAKRRIHILWSVILQSCSMDYGPHYINYFSGCELLHLSLLSLLLLCEYG